MKKNIRSILIVVAIVAVFAGAFYYLNRFADDTDGRLQASGTIEAEDVAIAAEISGRVAAIYVEEGDQVRAGDAVLRLDDSLLKGRRKEAAAGVETAKAAVKQAQAGLQMAALKSDDVLRKMRLGARQQRIAEWKQRSPGDYDLPLWYFTRDEELGAAEKRVDALEKKYTEEKQRLQDVLSDGRHQAFLDVENRLLDARIDLKVAEDVLQRSKHATDKALKDAAQDQVDNAKAELEAAQSEYDRFLSSQEAEDILDARARVSVAREAYYTGLDHLYQLQNGDQSAEVALAKAAVQQAETALEQTQASLAQAQARLAFIDLQLEKTLVSAPTDGVVLSRNLDAGEVVPAGVSFITIGKLDRLTIKVYLPEDTYGVIRLGDKAKVSVDSFPGKVFDGVVISIAGEAEYTPRNVQTTDGRKTTVYAVKLSVKDPNRQLKPGMPADVDFGDR